MLTVRWAFVFLLCIVALWVLKAPRKVRKGGEAAEPLLLAVGLQFWLSARYFGCWPAILAIGLLF
jgi:hypothetical protein